MAGIGKKKYKSQKNYQNTYNMMIYVSTKNVKKTFLLNNFIILCTNNKYENYLHTNIYNGLTNIHVVNHDKFWFFWFLITDSRAFFNTTTNH